MSTHSVNVIQLGEILPHPNADKLEMTKVGEYTCLIPKNTYKAGDLAVYIEPDYVVPDTEQFAFLGSARAHRIGAKKLRGVWSEGLLVPAPAGAKPGDDVMGPLGIVRWEPPDSDKPSWFGVKGPSLGALESVPDFIKTIPKYDLENLKKYSHLLKPGEIVRVTEKLHGTNARYVWHDGRMYAGSRSQWRKQEPANVYWSALAQCPDIEKWCMDHPNEVLCGEIYGDVQDMKYGCKQGEHLFAAFDLWDGKWHVPPQDDVPCVPLYGEVEYALEHMKEWAEQDSTYGGIQEGLVIQPLKERMSDEIGRVKLRLVSNRYLSR